LFEIDFTTSRHPHSGEYGQPAPQTEITVDAIRLDSLIPIYGKTPDLICMDLQEAELIALRGLGEYIKDVKYILFEASVKSTYKGGCSLKDVHEYLVENNFSFLKTNKSHFTFNEAYFEFADYLYVNMNI
jgi:hypothetical protein